MEDVLCLSIEELGDIEQEFEALEQLKRNNPLIAVKIELSNLESIRIGNTAMLKDRIRSIEQWQEAWRRGLTRESFKSYCYLPF